MSHHQARGMESVEATFGAMEAANAEALIGLALSEDLSTTGDLTARVTIPAEAEGHAAFVARSEGVLCGLPIAERLAERFSLRLVRAGVVQDGARLTRGEVIAIVSGSMRSLLAFERTALNFLQRLSGVATTTHRYVEEVRGTRARILDTRKTTPGWRLLEKYAVRCGGGFNHRIGLYDGVLIKDNHLAWLAESVAGRNSGPEALSDVVATAVHSARREAPHGTIVEIEVDSLAQFDRALECCPDIVLVDNFPVSEMAEAVQRRNSQNAEILVEASGGVNLSTVRKIAETGVDRISVGALTHSSPALDIALDYTAAWSGSRLDYT